MYTKEQLQMRIDQLRWFHRIDLPYEEGGFLTTPGHVDHCTPAIASKRFGIPENLNRKTVLDVGAWDGYFSFLAEYRGADYVQAIDPMAGCSNMQQMPDTFWMAKMALDSRVEFEKASLTEFAAVSDAPPFDIVFYFGVLYHVDNPLIELIALAHATREYALIETAVSTRMLSFGPMWEFKPGFNGDPTNKWYPTGAGLDAALLHAGFSRVQVIHVSRDRSRVTVKAYK